MKILIKLFLLLCFLCGGTVYAEQFRVLVLPASVFSVCQNYYCFEEPSNIFAEDIVNGLNKSGRFIVPDLYSVRKKAEENPTLKSQISSALGKYNSSNYIDFDTLKKIANTYDVKSILLISSKIQNRDMWEVLEISSVFEAVTDYTLNTNAVLLDNVNDVVMWSGKYNKKLGDNNSRFWATNLAQANTQYEKIKFYSNDIISKNICQNVTLRFFPKTLKQVMPEIRPQTTDFRPNALDNFKPQPKEEYGEIDSETIFTF